MLGYQVEQELFSLIVIHYGLWFLAFGLLFWVVKPERIFHLILLGILLRLVMVFGLPRLSDDIYRFVWDGRLLLEGINPFDYKPNYYAEESFPVPGLDFELYELLNSPDYFTIYPPIAQLTFYIANWLSPTNILGASIIMKLFLLATEIGNIFILRKLLHKFNLSASLVLLYALNPLIIVEIVGNLHFEGMMIFFLLLAYWYWSNNSWWKGGIFMALSIASKLLPLMFLPFLIRRMGWRKSIQTFILIGILVGVMFFPLFNAAFIQNFSNSLDLYFRRFEFNGSMYYALRWLGYQVKGNNLIKTIGPILAMGTFLAINLWALFEKRKDWLSWAGSSLFAICVYLLFTTTIHPWYTSLPIVLCLFTKFRFPIIWSGLITLTYINYSYNPYYENLWIVLIEYSLVLIYFIWELTQKFSRG